MMIMSYIGGRKSSRPTNIELAGDYKNPVIPYVYGSSSNKDLYEDIDISFTEVKGKKIVGEQDGDWERCFDAASGRSYLYSSKFQTSKWG